MPLRKGTGVPVARADCKLALPCTYGRWRRQGTRVRQFRCQCRQSGRTISLVPDCLTAHLSGTLEAV